MTVVVVAGIPASGKTTLARALARELGAPLVSKDVVKEALLDVLGTGTVGWASELSRAAHRVMYAVVPDLTGDAAGVVVLEAHFARGVAEADLVALGHDLVQVYCRCPVDVAWERYRERAADPARHPGHLPEHQDERATAHWRSTPPGPLELPGPLVEVDTTTSVDVVAVAERVRRLVSPDPGRG